MKSEEVALQDQSIYPAATRWICKTFHEHLVESNKSGLVLLDSRTKFKNVPNAVGVLTQRLRSGGDLLPRLLDSPMFGHSDTHVVLQLADIVVSGLLFPIACTAFCSELNWNTHASPAYEELRNRFGKRLKELQFRYQELGEWRGGIYPTKVTGSVSARAMFKAEIANQPIPGLESETASGRLFPLPDAVGTN